MSKKDIPTFSYTISTAYEGYPFFDYLFQGDYCKDIVTEIFNMALKMQYNYLISLSLVSDPKSVAIFTPINAPEPGIFRHIMNGSLKLSKDAGNDVMKSMANYKEFASNPSLTLT